MMHLNDTELLDFIAIGNRRAFYLLSIRLAPLLLARAARSGIEPRRGQDNSVVVLLRLWRTAPQLVQDQIGLDHWLGQEMTRHFPVLADGRAIPSPLQESQDLRPILARVMAGADNLPQDKPPGLVARLLATLRTDQPGQNFPVSRQVLPS